MTNQTPHPARRFRVYHPLYLAFFSKELYQDVGRNWTGLGFGYLLLLLALAWIPPMLQLQVSVSRWVRNHGREFAAQFPRITITNGQVEVDPPGPHVFKDPDTGTDFLIIDTTRDAAQLEDLQGDVAVLTKSQLVIKRTQRGETRVHDLSGVRSLSLDRNDLEVCLRFAENALGIVVYPFVLFFWFIYRIVQVLIYAAIGTLFAKAAKASLDYAKLVRLSAVAITAPVLLDTLKGLARVSVPLWWPICFLLAMAYLWFAVRANAEAPPSPPGLPEVPYTGPPGPAR